MQASMDHSATSRARDDGTRERPSDPSAADFPWPSLAFFPERLNFALARARLRPGELASGVSVSRKVISNMRTRQHRRYSGPYLQAIASFLDAPPDWLGSNSAPGGAEFRLHRERHDAVEDLAAAVTRLLEKKLISQSEIVALTNMMRIRESDARRMDNAVPIATPASAPTVPTGLSREQAGRWPQPTVTRLMAVAGRQEAADAA